MRSVEPLTKRQREILTYITIFIGEHGFAPSLEEIGQAMGLHALATVHKHLQNLGNKGYIVRRWNRSRSIQLTMPKGCCPTCGRTLEVSVDPTGPTPNIES